MKRTPLARRTLGETDCKRCGRTFAKRSPIHSYCNEACNQAARRERVRQGGYRSRACQECGATFTPTGGGQKFCTPDCRWAAGFVDAECAVCGESFRWNRQWGARRVCGKSCAARLQRRAAPEERHRTCEQCGETFVVREPGVIRVFCSPACFYAGRQQAKGQGLRRRPSYRHHVFSLEAKGEDACRNCGRRAHHLHHIVPRSKSAGPREDLNNGLPLCFECHSGWHAGTTTITQDRLTPAEVECALRWGGQWWMDHRYPPCPLAGIDHDHPTLDEQAQFVEAFGLDGAARHLHLLTGERA